VPTSLGVPSYIRNAKIADDKLTYRWDEWDTAGYRETDEDDDLHSLLEPLTTRACIAFTVAIAEWLHFRFAKVNQDNTPLEFLEAAWAGNIHRAYCEYTEVDDDEWRGPIRGPLSFCITLPNDALFCLDEDPDAMNRVVWTYNLTRHVLPSSVAFDAWFDAALERLKKHHGKETDSGLTSEDDLFGPAVEALGSPPPRELFDPSRRFDPTEAPALLDAFLKGLNPEQNPFLIPSEDVAESDGFEGTPYRYQAPNQG
jgi:hypothetical protein